MEYSENEAFTDFASEMDLLGAQQIPFVFIIDYEQQKPLLWKLKDIPEGIRFNMNGFTNDAAIRNSHGDLTDFYFRKYPVDFESYRRKFDRVVSHIKAGDSFLVNLSQPTAIETNLSLEAIYEYSQAPYRFYLKDRLVCFSPEIFISIKGNHISSFPMKGTIDEAVPDAARLILEDPKEKAEHATIVDLIRNDLSRVSKKVWVRKYRFLDAIETHEKKLLQVSSEISGIVSDDLRHSYGSILSRLLPAGSICGAPKPSTLQIIRDTENYERGYYTGIMGYYDGRETFNSAVMIRYIEQDEAGNKTFKSGGGITARSQAGPEYQEMIDKVYLPVIKKAAPEENQDSPINH